LAFRLTPLSRQLFGGCIARNLLQALALGFGEQEQGHGQAEEANDCGSAFSRSQSLPVHEKGKGKDANETA
jgi:hypothetical protein